MVLLYIAYCILTIYIGFQMYKKMFNPITVYSAVWGAAVIMHQSGLVYYYNLSAFFWLTIFTFHTIFALGCIVGNKVMIRGSKRITVDWGSCGDNFRKKLKRYIWITLALASVAIITNLAYAISIYGTNLYDNLLVIYSNRVNLGENINKVPYLSSFIYVSIALGGVYLRRYGFCIPTILALLLGAAQLFTSGGRAGIIFIVLIFISAFMLSSGSRKVRKDRRLDKKRYRIMAIAVAAAVVFILIISQRRAAGQAPAYATELYETIFGTNAVPYKLITYVSGPIGALNEYLKTCDFHFGQNTFKTVFNVLEKFGLMERIDQYQEWFYTPSSCNVATWIRELIEDFTYVGAMIAAFIFSFIIGQSYKKASRDRRVSSILLSSIWFMVMALSFFDWKLRSADIWIALLGCYFFGRLLDKEGKVDARQG